MVQVLQLPVSMATVRVDSRTISRNVDERAAERRYRAALARVDRGTFGLCVDCERPIERALLDVEPLMERCARCRRRSSQSSHCDA